MSAENPWEDFKDPTQFVQPVQPVQPDASPAAVAGPWEGYRDPTVPTPPAPKVVVPNQPFGELKPYNPTPTERVTGAISDAFRAMGADPYTGTKLARGVTDVVKLIPPVGVAAAGADAQSRASQGDFGGAAWDALGVLPAGRMGSILRTGAAAPEVLRPNFADPTKGEAFRTVNSGDLLAAGEQGYKDFRGSLAIYTPQAARTFVNDTRAALKASGSYPGANPGVYEALDVLENKANAQTHITRQDVDEFRAALSKLKTGKEAPTAMAAQSSLYDAMDKTGDPTLRLATENYGAGKRADIVETILRNSERAKNPDVALANKLRSEVQTREVRPRGFEQSEVEALDAARRGSPLVRGLETAGGAISKYGTLPGAIGAGGSVVAGLTGHISPEAAVKAAILGPAVPGGAAMALNRTASSLRRGAVQEAADLVAQRSPLYQDALAANRADQLFEPTSDAQRSAIAQAMISRYFGRQ